MAASRIYLSSALGLVMALLSSSTAQNLITPTPCITVTSTIMPTGCTRPHICPEIACPLEVKTLTRPCHCLSPVETVYETVSCGCPGCPTLTAIATAQCESLPCPVVTETAAPGCPPVPGCVTPDCAILSTLAIPCGCKGIGTVTECYGKCATGCETFYTGLGLPCPTAVAL